MENMVSASMDNTIIVWDAETGQALRPLIGHRDGIGSIMYTVDRMYIALGYMIDQF